MRLQRRLVDPLFYKDQAQRVLGITVDRMCEATRLGAGALDVLTAKQVRLYGTAYVDGDVTHEQLAIESGAFFQGRSLKFQRPAPALEVVTVSEEPAAAKAV